MGDFGGLLGKIGGFFTEKPSDNNLNPQQQPVNNISSAANTNDYNQKDIDRMQMYRDRNWAPDDTINMDLWNDPRHANNPVFDDMTERYGEPTQNPDGTFSHHIKVERDQQPAEEPQGPGKFGQFMEKHKNLVNEPTPEAPASDYDKMMKEFGEHWQQDTEGMEDIMNRISYHETGPYTRMDPTTVQHGGGPGRGLFQFESGAGQGGVTARNRLAKWYENQGMETPEWLNQEGMDESGFDASRLTPEQQKMMFLANTRYHPTASLKGVSGENVTDYWQKYHYAGKEDKTGIFDESMAAYDTNYKPTTDEAAFGPHS